MKWRRACGMVTIIVAGACSRPHAAANHRPVATACPAARPDGNAMCQQGGACASDAECDAGTNGRCFAHQLVSTPCMRECTYDRCFTDDDCGAGSACLCGVDPSWSIIEGNACVKAACRVDADCPNGFACSLSVAPSCGGEPAYYCHTPSDDCIDTSDCSRVSTSSSCAFDGTKWSCSMCGQDA